MIVAGFKLALDSEDLPRVSEHHWKTAYGPCHVVFQRSIGTRYHPREQSLASYILKTFQEVEFVSPRLFKDYRKENLKVVAR